MNCPDELHAESKLRRQLGAEVIRLHAERCYICRPDMPGVSQEGCADCDEKAGLHAQITVLRAALGEGNG